MEETTLQLYDFGFTDNMMPEGRTGTPARVISVHKGRYGIVWDGGEGYAQLKSKEYYYEGETFPTVGDFVLIDPVENGDSRITATLPRRTFFSRRDPDVGRGEQLIAANFDYVFLMQSLNDNFNPKRMERYLTAVRQSGAQPVVILTKADLTDDYLPYILETSRVAEGVETHIVSSQTGYGMEYLNKYLQKGRTLVFLGSSGVGKSSLVNALAGEEIMDTSGIRESDSRGRHTTTHRQLVMLPCGAMVIDTPGMRELGMWDVTEGLGQAFTDIETLAQQCRFRDCRHENEPGCAVREAIEKGELDERRLESYRKLRTEAKYSDDKVSYRRQKEQWAKSVSVYSRKMKKEGKIKK